MNPITTIDEIRGTKILLLGLPAVSDCPNGTVYGNYSVCLPNGVRAINKRHAVVYDGVTDTQTRFTRCFLRSLGRRRFKRSQVSGMLRTRPPQYCVPSESKSECLYVDIVRAYPSIYQRLSWMIDYERGKYFSTEADWSLIYPFPEHWKAGRSYVITGALPGSRRIVKDGAIKNYASYNPYFNPSLVACVWDILCAIARYAIDLYDARYFNLDGCVIPSKNAERYGQFLEWLGLDYRVKYHGHARLHNLGSWRIGEHSTRRFSESSLIRKVDGVPISRAEADWVLRHFAYLKPPPTYEFQTCYTVRREVSSLERFPMAVELTWDQVLAESGTQGEAKGLSRLAGHVATFTELKRETRGRTNKREVVTALGSANGTSLRVRLPDRYGKRVLQVLESRGLHPNDQGVFDVKVSGRVEDTPRGPVIKPVEERKPDPERSQAARERAQKRKRGQPQNQGQ